MLAFSLAMTLSLRAIRAYSCIGIQLNSPALGKTVDSPPIGPVVSRSCGGVTRSSDLILDDGISETCLYKHLILPLSKSVYTLLPKLSSTLAIFIGLE